jgi:two-component system cell cycle sensor histidine kinase/response regulator CckA
LLQSEEQYRLLFASVPRPMWVADADSLKFLAVNDAAILHYGYARDEFESISAREIICEEAAVTDLMAPLRIGPGTQVLKHRKKDGTVIDVEIVGRPIVFEGRAAQLSLVIDVTDRKLADARLQASEKKFAKAFYLSPLALSIATLPEGRVLDANGALFRILGYDPEQMIGKTVHELGIWTFPKDRERMLQSLGEEDRSIGLETVFTTQSGETKTVLVFSEAIELDGVPCVLSVTHDVTERKQLEQQLRQAQRMDAVGRLAGGVAHDFNNMLGVIRGYSELLRTRVCDELAQEQIEEIKKASDRAASLTRQLLAFSRRQVLQPASLDLNERISQISKMLRRLIGDDVQLIVRPGDSLAAIEADPGQIDQVILNLAVNARDAMPCGGKLLLETSNIRLDDSSLFQQRAVKPGPYVMLAISDTGCGMDAETLAHIFEPFFTTKEYGKGTGLGLSTVHGIVTQSEGYIWVASQPGQGSTFKICLPASRKKHARATLEANERREVARGSATILLVEDEESMRKLTRHLLEGPGYRVLEACDGAEAIELARQNNDIQLLLTDVVMPRLSGPGLAERIKASNPQIEVIYMSGYTDELLVRHGALGQGITFLEKPFTQDSLVNAVQTALAGTHAARVDRARGIAKS